VDAVFDFAIAQSADPAAAFRTTLDADLKATAAIGSSLEDEP
jgi:hypothetical protein